MNSYNFSNTMLTNGHSHFVLLGNDMKKLEWGKESKFKISFIERLIKGKKIFLIMNVNVLELFLVIFLIILMNV